MTIKDVLAKQTTSPATPAEIRAAGHLVRRIMQHNSGSTDNQAVVKTKLGVKKLKKPLIFLILHMQLYKLVKYNIAHHLGAGHWIPWDKVRILKRYIILMKKN